ncbi:hypothetical protein AKJ66_01540 [candidate division MSBL1 archaeon SCGC-AAA259E22]|uniref:Uncharacterized protein n=1 Tax=candidate division MSBL1 archaeon SCGC-AAA259E22 TaxID=1698265 RepID=A0A133UHK9_9EURY|nr:hypothetical protein AKJ66_01540 [candidate division MSBL1 archaeon SCGC-AAA259E22]
MNFERFQNLRKNLLSCMSSFFENPDYVNKSMALTQLRAMEEEILSTSGSEDGVSEDDLSHSELACADLQSSLATCEGPSSTKGQIKELRNALRDFLQECKIIELKTKGMKVDADKWRERRREEKKEEKEEKISPGEIFKGMTTPELDEEDEEF